MERLERRYRNEMEEAEEDLETLFFRITKRRIDSMKAYISLITQTKIKFYP